jgi:acetoin utilization deacetylase AcuC-like enzyme
MSNRVVLFSDEQMLLHDAGSGHPERAARLRAVLDMVGGLSLPNVSCASPQAARRQDVARVHEGRYVDWIDSLRGKSARLDADTAVSPASVSAAYVAAGAAMAAIEALATAEAARTFALVRPPGHHAEADRAMGFCLFNNIAIAAASAIEQFKFQRVLIVDWDVHHGNGTQHIFETRRDVLFFSSHQWPFYPGTGAIQEIGVGQGEGFTVNAPLPPGFDDAGFVALYERLLVPIAREYQPDLILVSAGFDAHERDPIGGMAMTESGFAALCAVVRDIADRHAGGKLGLVLEGGYDLKALAESVRACIDILAGAQPPHINQPSKQTLQVIDAICAFHRKRWPV